MTGGAFKNSSNLLSRRREIEEFEKTVRHLKKEMEEMEASAASLRRERAACYEAIDEIQQKLQKAYVIQNTAKINLDQCQERIQVSMETSQAIQRENQELERRLDNVAFRMGFARTRREARQIVGHKHLLVNGKKVNIPSYLVKAGDVIELTEKAKGLQRYKEIVEVTAGRLVPEWMDADLENFKGTIKELPTREMIDVPVDEMLIVELYTK